MLFNWRKAPKTSSHLISHLVRFPRTSDTSSAGVASMENNPNDSYRTNTLHSFIFGCNRKHFRHHLGVTTFNGTSSTARGRTDFATIELSGAMSLSLTCPVSLP
eukprot:GHVN01097065.1.p1 GENE.GHVN01097065.1~~GHVN01097065.1.p1  ORF type:complete len:104 (-),score=10.95 GHVN01097065.1:420-731(-)